MQITYMHSNQTRQILDYQNGTHVYTHTHLHTNMYICTICMHIIYVHIYLNTAYALYLRRCIYCISIQSYIQRNKLRKDNSFMRNLVHKPLIRGEKCQQVQTIYIHLMLNLMITKFPSLQSDSICSQY